MIVNYHLVMIKWVSINDLCMALKKKGSEERFRLEERNAITMISNERKPRNRAFSRQVNAKFRTSEHVPGYPPLYSHWLLTI